MLKELLRVENREVPAAIFPAPGFGTFYLGPDIINEHGYGVIIDDAVFRCEQHDRVISCFDHDAPVF